MRENPETRLLSQFVPTADERGGAAGDLAPAESRSGASPLIQSGLPPR